MTSRLELTGKPPAAPFANVSHAEITMAAHDLRNPLSCLVLTLELIEARTGETAPDELRKVVQRGLRAADRMYGMIQRLLDNGRPKSALATTKTAPADLTRIVGDAIEHSQLNAQKKGIRIHVSGPGILTDVDDDLLVEAVDNLISNAVKFSPLNGEVSCRIGQDERSAFIQVTDHGKGLTRHDLADLGKPFQRLSAKPSAGEKSSGLGLWSTRRIINSLGGELVAESNGINKGAAFMLRLPVASTRARGITH